MACLRAPLRLFLDFAQLIDTNERNGAIEERLVNDGYKNDPDFERWYPLGAIMSLVTAAPPRPLSALATPALFMVPRFGFIPPAYFEDLNHRLPPIRKGVVEVDGSVYWMLSHPRKAARMICRWFDQTISAGVGREPSAQQSGVPGGRPPGGAASMTVMRQQHRTDEARVTFDMVLRELRRRDFAVLSTADEQGRPHSVGVEYGVSPQGADIYVMTRQQLKKARNIAANPWVSLVVPLTRRLLWFLPPPCIQFKGTAEILGQRDEIGTATFQSFFKGRRILRMYDEMERRGEKGICFLRITPDSSISTYMVGYSIWEVRRRMEVGVEKVGIPAEYRRRP